MSNKHIAWTPADFVEQAEHDFNDAMLDLANLEWAIRDALDELDRISA